MKKILLRIGSILFLCLLLINPTLSIEGAKTGLLFWFNTIIPTLLPFMIGSNLIVAMGATKYLTFFLSKILNRIGNISENGCYAVLIGLLCGCPMGAKTSADMVVNGDLRKVEGQYLLAFSNHVSPMFLVGFVLSAIQGAHKTFFLLSYYIPVLPIMFAAKKYYHIEKPEVTTKRTLITATEQRKKRDVLDKSMTSAFEVIVKIGGHIILFSIFEAYFAQLPMSNLLLKSLIIGSIEITSGIVSIGNTYPGSILGELLAVTVSAFGGFSSLAQTKSVISEAGLSVIDYFMWKGLHGLLAAGCFLFFLKFL